MRARALLEPAEPFEDEDEESTAHAGELQCLKCGATSVEEDHGAYKRSILISIFAAIAASLPFPPRRAYRCRSCGYRWRARVR